MIVQIYEIQRPQEAEKCLDLGVDHLGSVILSTEEWKNPLIKEVMRLTEGTTAKNALIPLFSNPEILYRTLDHYRPHFVHFCESLTDAAGQGLDLSGFIELQNDLKDRFPEIRIMRSIPVPRHPEWRDRFPTLRLARAMEPVSDAFLTDTWVEKAPVDGYIGITGLTADLELVSRLVAQSRIPVILAGGLSPANVYESLLTVLPAGADSCTHTNETDGESRPVRFKKDLKKVEAFVRETRRAHLAILEDRARLVNEVATLEEELRDRHAALPAHSIRPHQLRAIEDLEEALTAKRRVLERYRENPWTSS